ncbi:hypothetical protein F4802DRAFT_559249, partial [Xylaria palmicola]
MGHTLSLLRLSLLLRCHLSCAPNVTKTSYGVRQTKDRTGQARTTFDGATAPAGPSGAVTSQTVGRPMDGWMDGLAFSRAAKFSCNRL